MDPPLALPAVVTMTHPVEVPLELLTQVPCVTVESAQAILAAMARSRTTVLRAGISFPFMTVPCLPRDADRTTRGGLQVSSCDLHALSSGREESPTPASPVGGGLRPLGKRQGMVARAREGCPRNDRRRIGRQAAGIDLAPSPLHFPARRTGGACLLWFGRDNERKDPLSSLSGPYRTRRSTVA